MVRRGTCVEDIEALETRATSAGVGPEEAAEETADGTSPQARAGFFQSLALWPNCKQR